MNLQKLLREMTMEEKIGQLTQYNANLFSDSSAEVTGPMQDLGLTSDELKTVGSVLNFSGFDQVKRIQQKHLQQDPHKIPMAFMLDVIHGYRTIYPIPLGLACSFDPELSEECAAMAAREASADGVHVTFAPMVDYTRDPRWGRVMEAGGEEPLVTGAMAAAQVRGFQGESIARKDRLAACVKHYAGYGGAEAGRDYNLVELSNRELRQFYLPAYKACLDAGAQMIMPSFNSLNGVPSTANDLLMNQILRGEWGFDGVVISDFGAIQELIPHGVAADQKEAAALAFGHGCHIEMCTSTYFHHLRSLVEEGTFPEEMLDQAVLKVLELKQQMGLFEDPYHGASEERARELFLCDKHREIARRAAAESAVLLKNEGILPLRKDLKTVAVIGPFAQERKINGFWKCAGVDTEPVSVEEGIRNRLPDAQVLTAEGCSNQWDSRDVSGFDEAIRIARNADAVILCLGEPQDYSGEGNCRVDIRLPGMQEELARRIVEVNSNTAVVLFNGRPLDLSAVDAVAPAILEMWFPGTEGGNAVADLLLGNSNPCGKLTMTFPRNVGQCPIYYNHPNTGRPHWTTSTQRVTFTSSYLDECTLPLYSFGHGLSYSHIVYEKMVLSSHIITKEEPILVTVHIRNQSDIATREVVQLYMRDMVASVVRPVQQLIAFEKVALAPWEEKEVTFCVKESMLRFWNSREEYISEPGAFQLMTGFADHFAFVEEMVLQ